MASAEDASDGKRDGQKRFVMGPADTFEGKLTYDGAVSIGGRCEGELRVTGNVEVGSSATVKALIEGASVTLKGSVEGLVTARDKLTLGRNARLNGDVQAKRLQIDDGASFNGHIRMGDVEQHASGG
ncbi:MAG TPA: polymer-forming cytoskeletal protein [Patescibacteria group bacterium]|nr:polymer-forming cytoskeletal protein [Patescibacteria group bacterium]